MTNRTIKLAVYLVFLTVYIIPNGLIFGPFSAVHNHIFAAIIGLMYIVPKMRTGKVNKQTILIWICVITVAVYTGRFGFIDMIIIPIVDEFIQHKEYIKRVISKSMIVYISILLTFAYSALYSITGMGGRGEGEIGSGLVFSAIGEINLSGLSIFCLALITRKKNKYLGDVLLLFGILTVSRSYILALICLLLFNIRIVKRVISKVLEKLTYFNLTVISSVLFVGFGVISMSMFLNGGIADYVTNAGFSRLFKINDYSNYFRFLAIYLVAMIFVNSPKAALLGVSDEEFLKMGYEICTSKGLLFTGIGPHNLFFSHLKMYGIAVFFEIYYVSKYLKKIVSVNNFGIFIAVFFYAIVLGTGMCNYWLYLLTITLIVYE